jgi:hypothetical protein
MGATGYCATDQSPDKASKSIPITDVNPKPGSLTHRNDLLLSSLQ